MHARRWSTTPSSVLGWSRARPWSAGRTAIFWRCPPCPDPCHTAPAPDRRSRGRGPEVTSERAVRDADALGAGADAVRARKTRRPARSDACTRAVAVGASVPAATEHPKAPSDDKRWRIVETRMRRLGNQPDALVEALHSTQEAFGYLDTDALRYVGQTLSRAAVDGVRRRDVLPLLHAQAGRASTRRSCAPGPPATSTARAGSWRPSASGWGSARSRRPTTGRSRCSPRAASAPAASRRPRSSTARSRAASTARRSSTGWSAVTTAPAPTPARRRPRRAGPARAATRPARSPASSRRARRARPPTSARPSAACPPGRRASSRRSSERVDRRGAGRRRDQARRLPRPVRERPAGPGPGDGRGVHRTSRPTASSR